MRRSLSPHYLRLNYNETPRKYGFKALSCHCLCRPQHNPPGVTPKSAHAALLLSCPIFTCVVLYMTRVSARTHIQDRSLTHARTHCTVKCITCIRTHSCAHHAALQESPNLLGWDSCLARCRTLTGHMLTPSDFFFVLTSSLVPLRVTTLC